MENMKKMKKLKNVTRAVKLVKVLKKMIVKHLVILKQPLLKVNVNLILVIIENQVNIQKFILAQ
jgi:hypothetical protein